MRNVLIWQHLFNYLIIIDNLKREFISQVGVFSSTPFSSFVWKFRSVFSMEVFNFLISRQNYVSLDADVFEGGIWLLVLPLCHLVSFILRKWSVFWVDKEGKSHHTHEVTDVREESRTHPVLECILTFECSAYYCFLYNSHLGEYMLIILFDCYL